MPHHLVYNFVCALASLIIPGLGQAIKGYWPKALGFLAALLGCFIFICLSRLIFVAWGLEALTLLVALIHVTSAISAARLPILPVGYTSRVFKPTLFAVLCIGLGTAIFSARASVLGINLYYVPSASMSPTLLPGDLILVDTRAYAERQPKIGDVTVFSVSEQSNSFHVKRIRARTDEGAFIMRGDNVSASLDSRYYGEIPLKSLLGEVVRFIRYRPHHAFFQRMLFGYVKTNRSL